MMLPDGAAIRRAREIRGWSIGDLAGLADVGPFELAMIEREALSLDVIPIDAFFGIAQALGVPMEAIISPRTRRAIDDDLPAP